MTAPTLSPNSGPLKLNPTLPDRAPAAAAEQRHRTHCPLCSGDDAKTAEEFVDALYAAHAPFLNRGRLPNLLSKRGPRR